VRRWQLQDAKQQFSRMVEHARNDGPQVVTRHGKDVAIVLAVEEYRRLGGELADFKQFLLSAPPLHELAIERDGEPSREIEL
jgi:prevent-host-death family protein